MRVRVNNGVDAGRMKRHLDGIGIIGSEGLHKRFIIQWETDVGYTDNGSASFIAKFVRQPLAGFDGRGSLP